jgi:hypothetical protein
MMTQVINLNHFENGISVYNRQPKRLFFAYEAEGQVDYDPGFQSSLTDNLDKLQQFTALTYQFIAVY